MVHTWDSALLLSSSVQQAYNQSYNYYWADHTKNNQNNDCSWYTATFWSFISNQTISGWGQGWTRITFPVWPWATMLLGSIQALVYAFWYHLIFAIRAAIGTFLAAMSRIFLGIEESCLTCSIAYPVRMTGARCCYNFMLCTHLTAMTRSWVKFIRECSFKANHAIRLCWICNTTATRWIQSTTLMTSLTIQTNETAVWFDFSVLVFLTDFLALYIRYLVNQIGREMSVYTIPLMKLQLNHNYQNIDYLDFFS